MAVPEIALHRLRTQRIAEPRFESVAEVVRHLGAMQAQDYAASVWAIGLRTQSATFVDVDAAVERREIARTWPMRGTLHWVPAEDLRWMVALMAPRAVAKAAARTRQLEIDAEVLSKARALLTGVLSDGPPITRPEAYALFEGNALRPEGQRGIHILQQLAHEGTLCFGPHQGKQPTFVLIDRWLPTAKPKPRDEALAILAATYFTSHGPATVNDFAWWTGLTLADARAAVDSVRGRFESRVVEGREYWQKPVPTGTSATNDELHLLPGFDEYILGYQDRSAVLAPEFARLVVPGNNGMFMATVVDGTGEVLGTWQRRASKGGVTIVANPFPERAIDAAPLRAAAERYAGFLGVRLESVD